MRHLAVAPAWRGLAGFLLPALALYGVALTLFGYQAFRGDQAVVLPHYRAMADPDYLVRDWHVQAYRAVNPHRPWFGLLAILESLLGLPGALLAAHAAGFLLLCLAGTTLFRSLFPRAPPWGPWLAVAMLVAVPLGDLGSNPLYEVSAKPRFLAYPLVVLAVGLLLRVPLTPGAAAGAGLAMVGACLLHVGIGLLATVTLGLVALLWAATKGVEPRAILAFLALDALALGLRLPYLLEARSRLGAEGAEADLISLYLVMRAPHHFHPASWPRDPWHGFAGCLALGALAWPLLAPPVRRRLLALGAVVAAWLGVALAFSTVVPRYEVMLLQSFRLATVGRAVLLAMGAGAVAALATSGAPWGPSRALFLLASLGTPRALLLASATEAASRLRPAWFPGLAAAAVLATGPRSWASSVLQAGAVGLGALPWSRLRGAQTALAVALLGVVWTMVLGAPGSRWQFVPVPRDDAEALAAWCRDHTPPEALFLTPPTGSGFRFWAERAVVVDYDTPPLSGPELLEWSRRLAAVLGVPPGDLARTVTTDRSALDRYRDLAPGTLAGLARRYGADYVVAPQEARSADLEPVHRVGGLGLYQVQAP